MDATVLRAIQATHHRPYRVLVTFEPGGETFEWFDCRLKYGALAGGRVVRMAYPAAASIEAWRFERGHAAVRLGSF